MLLMKVKAVTVDQGKLLVLLTDEEEKGSADFYRACRSAINSSYCRVNAAPAVDA